MNELYLATQFIIEGLDSNPLINTVTFEKTSDIDLNKANIYPLVNVDIIDSSMDGEMLYFNYIVTILSDRNIDNDLNNDKIFNDNLIDNLNECHAIAVRFINHVRANNNNENDVEVFETTNIQMLRFDNTNILDGVRFNISLEIPNTTGC